MPALVVYSRQGCQLCEVLIEELQPMVRGTLDIEVRDIDSRPDWRSKYDIRVPVVEYEERPVSEYPLDRKAISELLGALPGEAGE